MFNEARSHVDLTTGGARAVRSGRGVCGEKHSPESAGATDTCKWHVKVFDYKVRSVRRNRQLARATGSRASTSIKPLPSQQLADPPTMRMHCEDRYYFSAVCGRIASYIVLARRLDKESFLALHLQSTSCLIHIRHPSFRPLSTPDRQAVQCLLNLLNALTHDIRLLVYILGEWTETRI